jgi:hypothetical protein
MIREEPGFSRDAGAVTIVPASGNLPQLWRTVKALREIPGSLGALDKLLGYSPRDEEYPCRGNAIRGFSHEMENFRVGENDVFGELEEALSILDDLFLHEARLTYVTLRLRPILFGCTRLGVRPMRDSPDRSALRMIYDHSVHELSMVVATYRECAARIEKETPFRLRRTESCRFDEFYRD